MTIMNAEEKQISMHVKSATHLIQKVSPVPDVLLQHPINCWWE